MSEKITINDQITYLESYASMIKAQYDMIQVQIKFLKAGKDMQDNMTQYQNQFLGMMNMFNPYIKNNGDKNE